MKFKPIALFLLVFALVGNAFADGSDDAKMSPSLQGKKLSFHDKSWYMGEKLVDPEVAFNAMKSNEESASAYSTAMGFYYPGMVLAYAGGAALGYGVVTWIWGENSDLGMYLTLGGAGVYQMECPVEVHKQPQQHTCGEYDSARLDRIALAALPGM